MTQAWQERALEQLQHFSGTDPKAEWHVAHQYCQALQGIEDKTKQVWRPEFLNLGSGKDYKLGWLNLDILERTQPDLVIDLGQQTSLPISGKTLGGGHILIEENSLRGIYANNVLEHVPDLPCLMTNLLALLKDGGILEVEVPYEKSVTAWQDPTHLRAMNKNSWLYYTVWFWYLGWLNHRFEITEFKWLDNQLKPCSEDQAAFMKLKLKKTTTTPHERSIARTMIPDFCGIPSDLI
jgi:SAM-dependent methyltransferase